RVSRESWPTPSDSRRRSVEMIKSPASAMSATTAMTMMSPMGKVLLQLEEESLGPREDEELPGASEERANDGQNGARHEEHGEKRDGELSVLRFGGGVFVDVR